MPGRVYGYARCSTTEKRQDIERQVAELRAMGATFVVQEFGSGAAAGRAGFAELMGALGEGDSLYAVELSRVTRSVRQLCEIVELAQAKRLRLRFGQLDFDCTGGGLAPFALAMLQIMGVFAELERNLAAERISSGIAHARGKGVRLGRPRRTAEQVPLSARGPLEEYLAGRLSMAGLARATGMSRPTLYKYAGLMRGGGATGGAAAEPGDARTRRGEYGDDRRD